MSFVRKIRMILPDAVDAGIRSLGVDMDLAILLVRDESVILGEEAPGGSEDTGVAEFLFTRAAREGVVVVRGEIIGRSVTG